MDITSLNFSLLSFRKRSFVWILLIIILISFVPVDSLAQRPTAKTSEADTIETVQRFLQQLGYNPGPIDRKMGEKTRTAIRAFQRDHNLQVDGEASMALVEALTQAILTQTKRYPAEEKE
jgi:peptidoglycan hydrolase-like protein with peptidoglycan-binding domain